MPVLHEPRNRRPLPIAFCGGSPLESKTRLGAGQAGEFENLRAEAPLGGTWSPSRASWGPPFSEDALSRRHVGGVRVSERQVISERG